MKSLSYGKMTGNYAEECAALREVLSLIGDKWSMLVIVNLGEGTKRFSELKRNIDGISQRMLTMTVRGLERDGLVHREVFPTIPPRVEYSLTKLGKNLLGPVSSLAKWAWKHRVTMEKSRAAFDGR